MLWPDACTGWDETVYKFAQNLTKQLGVAHTACVEALLQEASLMHEHISCVFDANTATPPDTFATMLLLLLAPGTVCLAPPASTFTHQAQQWHYVSALCTR